MVDTKPGANHKLGSKEKGQDLSKVQNLKRKTALSVVEMKLTYVARRQ